MRRRRLSTCCAIARRSDAEIVTKRGREVTVARVPQIQRDLRQSSARPQKLQRHPQTHRVAELRQREPGLATKLPAELEWGDFDGLGQLAKREQTRWRRCDRALDFFHRVATPGPLARSRSHQLRNNV